MLSVAAAIYLVSASVIRQAENALQREITGETPHRNTPEFSGAKYAADQTFFYFGFAVGM